MDPLPISNRITIPADELSMTAARAGGPGGQHVNTSSTSVELRFDPATSRVLNNNDKARIAERLAARLVAGGGVILIRARANRSQRRNLMDARERLAEMIRAALAPVKTRKATRPTRGSQERRLGAKKRRSATKRDRRQRGEDG